MTCKTILAPLSAHYVDSHSTSLERSALDAAFRMGRAWGARVRVLLLDAPGTDGYKPFASWMPMHGLEQIYTILEKANKTRREQALQVFQSMVELYGAPLVSASSASGFAVEFVESDGSVPELLAAQGKLADLIVIAHPSLSGPATAPPMLEVALRETGRPILVAPEEPVTTVAEHVAIAWNGSSEAARAIAIALDLLRAASKVTIISVQEGAPIQPSGPDLAEYLSRHSIAALPVDIKGNEHNAGACLLSECGHAEADLLLMGAYTRSRTRQLIFGGATSHILRKATIPLIMVE